MPRNSAGLIWFCISTASSALIAKFHYMDPTGPDRTGPDQTKSAHFVADRLNSTTRARPDPTGPARTFCSPGLRETPLGPCGSPTKSVRVRASPRGSGRARVVDFSLNNAHHWSRATLCNTLAGSRLMKHFSILCCFRWHVRCDPAAHVLNLHCCYYYYMYTHLTAFFPGQPG